MSVKQKEKIRDLVDQMLAMVEAKSYSIADNGLLLSVSLGGVEVVFDPAAATPGLAFEQLGSAIEARISLDRASRMVAACTKISELPLWLVSGSNVLAHWLKWSGASGLLRRSLKLSDRVGWAPVSGDLNRRARRELGQGAAKIRVRSGMAVAERIELSERPACIAMLGSQARILIGDLVLPETVIAALAADGRRNDYRRLAELVHHPFVASTDLEVISARNETRGVVFDLESHWMPLEPVPDNARIVVPRDADPTFPWRPTPREIRDLTRLVVLGSRQVGAH